MCFRGRPQSPSPDHPSAAKDTSAASNTSTVSGRFPASPTHALRPLSSSRYGSHAVSEMTHRTLEHGRTGRKLPARESFVQHELEKGPDHGGPENRGTQLAACERGSGKITGTHTGRGNQDAGTDQRQQARARTLSPRGSIQPSRQRGLS